MDLVSLFNTILMGDNESRKKAELTLSHMGAVQGFIPTVAQVAFDGNVDQHYRHLALFALRDGCRDHWNMVDDGTKASIRAALLPALCNPTVKLRAAVSSVVKEVAASDYPEHWPNLFESLCGMLQSGDMNALSGGLRCLQDVAKTLADSDVPSLLALSPVLLHIFCNAGLSLQLRARAGAIMRIFFDVLGDLSQQYPAQVRPALMQLLEQWTPAVMASLQSPPGQGPDYSLHLAAHRIITILITAFPKAAAQHIKAVLPYVFDHLMRGVNEFETTSVYGDGFEDLVQDDEGDALGIEAIIEQAIETLRELCNSRFALQLKKALPQLASVLIAYMQMTTDQEELWTTDPNQFAADEDDDSLALSVRIAGMVVDVKYLTVIGMELLAELVDAFPDLAPPAIFSAASARIEESAQRVAAGNPGGWKLREAALMAIGFIAPEVSNKALVPADLILKQVLPLDLQASMAHIYISMGYTKLLTTNLLDNDFLKGRALWTASRLAAFGSRESWGPYIQGSMDALAGAPIPVRVCACRALVRFAPEVGAEAMAPVLPSILSYVCKLTRETGDEILALVLETLTRLSKISEAATAAAGSEVLSVAIGAWQRFSNDPVLIDCAKELIAALAQHATIRPAVQAQVMNIVVVYLQDDATIQKNTGIVEASIDMLRMVLQYSDQVDDNIGNGLVPILFRFMQDPRQSGMVQNACDTLRAFLKAGREQFGGWMQGQAPAALIALCNNLLGNIVLDPEETDTSESACMYIGPLLTSAIDYAPQTFLPLISQVVINVVKRLITTKSRLFQMLLMLVFAQIAQTNAGQLVEILSTLTADAGALAPILRIWTEIQVDYTEPYEKHLTMTALGNLMSLADPRVEQTPVKGTAMHVATEGRRYGTRQTSQEQVVTVPFSVKVLELMADAVVRSLEEKGTIASREGNADDEDGDDFEDDEVDDGEEWQDEDNGDEKSPFAPAEDYDLDGYGGSENEDAMDPLIEKHPMTTLDFIGWLRTYLMSFAQRDPSRLQSLALQLPQEKQAILMRILQGQL